MAREVCRKGGPRAILEVKSPHIPTWMHEARLRGYDRAKAAKESAPKTRERRRTRSRAQERGWLTREPARTLDQSRACTLARGSGGDHMSARELSDRLTSGGVARAVNSIV